MNRKIFELALERLRSSDWEYFEELSSQFLASEFPDIRTMANPSGDGGRDSELFTPNGVANVAIQYSVSESWGSKIGGTVRRLKDTFPGTTVLIYMTNQVIGAKGDKKRAELIGKGVSLDIRDRSWFLDRFEIDDAKYGAASCLVDTIATPYLEGKELIEKKRPSLNNQEAKAALLYLGMQWEDESTQKGLTKVAYEALVRGALRGTDSDSRITRNTIHEKVLSFLSSHEQSEAIKFIDSALSRLTKKYIRHWESQDEFCLTHEESLRLQEKLVEQELEESKFESILTEYFDYVISDYESIHKSDLHELVSRAKRIIDRFLLKSGEEFASAVISGSIDSLDINTLKNVIIDDISNHSASARLSTVLLEALVDCVTHIVSSPSNIVKKHLRSLSDSYTIFAFLQEVPDVQSATKKIFSHGDIWLDTTIILPLLVDALKKEDDDKRFSDLLGAMLQSGVSMYVTPGVVREIVSHIRVAVICSGYATNTWKGRVPHLYYRYIELGYEPARFRNWVELFRGYERPEDDISDYLKQEFGIKTKSLEEEARTVGDELRYAVERLWTEAHERRRSSPMSEEHDDSITAILVRHDVESYLGIVALRKKEEVTELGYKSWWLTTDSIAWKIRDAIREEFKDDTPPSPLISIDFLAHNLSFGPSRGRLQRTEEQLLPILLDFDLSEVMPKEIIEVAEKVRIDNEGMPDAVIRRKVRDACDRAKRKCGILTAQAINAEQGAPADR